jgi:hypothetical protein
MPLTFLIDEHLRGGLQRALIARGLAQGVRVDVLQIGDEGAPGVGTLDSDILRWCASAGRILISFDKKSLPSHQTELLAGGRTTPGILILRPGVHWADVLDDLLLISQAGLPDDYRDCVTFIP